jgi:acyl-coenzyme A thioesterase PaaI-like protein
MTAATSSRSAAALESVLNFIKAGNLQPASKPGFGHALKLSYNTISKERLSIDSEQSLTYRYRFSPDVPKPSIGILTAIQDELSTNACFRVGQPSAPGLSLQMQTELLVKDFPASAMEEMDILNTVTKLGRTISHTRTDFFCTKSQQRLAHSTHVKFMPSGSRILDWLFNSPALWKLYVQLYLARIDTLPLYEEKPLIKDVIQSHLEFQGQGAATFHVTREHTNPFGALHGGCHAIVMEQVGQAYAKAELASEKVQLEMIQIEYLGAAKGAVEIVATTLGRIEHDSSSTKTIHVRVVLKRGERILSDGKLRFVSKL